MSARKASYLLFVLKIVQANRTGAAVSFFFIPMISFPSFKLFLRQVVYLFLRQQIPARDLNASPLDNLSPKQNDSPSFIACRPNASQLDTN
mmetsp:Transcript_73430/g.212685  ORF Transcript_73430/g.212685 Transcript_73430/m.212685 type:complete len:91 (-) Transcript_73430:768-1040(-)